MPERSLGVVDDTCERDSRIIVGERRTRRPAKRSARTSLSHHRISRRIGDRSLSLADEINDREYDPARDAALTDEQMRQWVEDFLSASTKLSP